MESLEKTISNLPIIKWIVAFLKSIQLPGFEGLSVFDLCRTYISGIVKGTFSSRATAIAYSFFMALFPFLLLILNIIPLLPIPGFQDRFLVFIQDLLPPQTQEFFLPVVEDIARNPRKSLLSFSIFLSIFLAANGVNAIFSAFEYSVHVTLNRNFFKQYFIAVAISILLALLLLLNVSIIIYGEYIIQTLKGTDLIQDDVFWINVLRVIFFIILIYISIAILYHFGVREGKNIRFFSIGALLTTLLFLLTTYLFGIYINNFSNYNELYGSIGALLIMLFYIWLNANLLLLGFELNSSLQHLKKQIK